MAEFRKGDPVVVVDDGRQRNGDRPPFRKADRFTVRENHGHSLWLEEITGFWRTHRFAPAKD